MIAQSDLCGGVGRQSEWIAIVSDCRTSMASSIGYVGGLSHLASAYLGNSSMVVDTGVCLWMSRDITLAMWYLQQQHRNCVYSQCLCQQRQLAGITCLSCILDFLADMYVGIHVLSVIACSDEVSAGPYLADDSDKNPYAVSCHV